MGAQRPLPRFLRSVPRHGRWPHPCARSRPSCCTAARGFPSPRASIQKVVAMAREDTGGPPAAHIHYSVCLSVRQSVRFLYFCTCILGLDIRPCLCPACHTGLQAPECPLRHTPVWAVGHIAVPGRREQESSGHNRAPGYGQVAVTSTHIPGLWPMDSSPSHTRLLFCLQLRVQSRAIPTRWGYVDDRVILVTQSQTAIVATHPWEVRVLKEWASATQEEALELYRYPRSGPPQAGKVLAPFRQRSKCARPQWPQPKPWGNTQLTQVVGGRFCPGDPC